MEREFWLSRWQEGRIGFHEGKPNEHLVAHGEALGLAGARVLVPLCGKSVDLAWLAARCEEVVGVELATAAVEAFFAEQGLVPERTQAGRMTLYEADNVTIWAGDFFELDPAMVGPIDVCFDRAALVAIRPSDRERYVAQTRSLLAPDARTLLVTFEHDAPVTEPPFSVPEEDVRALFAGDRIEVLDVREAMDPRGPLASRGATFGREKVYRVGRG
jgi:thiopurine S-methyltransferase